VEYEAPCSWRNGQSTKWEWGDIEIGGHTFQVPIKWTIHNELAVNLRKKKLILYVKMKSLKK